MKCSKCGKDLPDDAKFCTKCGTPLRMLPPRNAQGHPPAPGAYPGRNYQNYPAYGTPEPPKKRRGFLLPLLIVLLLLLVGGGGVFAFMHFRDSAESSSISEDRDDRDRKKSRKKDTDEEEDEGQETEGTAAAFALPETTAAAAETTAAAGTAAAAVTSPASSITSAAAAPVITTAPVPYSIALYMPDYISPGRILPVKRTNVSASSMLNDTGYDHSAYMAFDGLPESSWMDGANREAGEYIEVYFDTPETYNTIAIFSGNFRTEALHVKNNTPTRILMDADGVEYHFDLNPDMAVNVVEFTAPVTSQRVRFTVENYLRGTAYNDTTIADITFSDSSSAPNGMKPDWVQEAAGWAYFDRNGERLYGWHTLNGENYYFTPDGIMGTDWQLVGSDWFYLGSDGVRRTGWQNIGGADYYFQDDGVMLHDARSPEGYYLGSDGKRRR